jgi:hypothetical protein
MKSFITRIALIIFVTCTYFTGISFAQIDTSIGAKTPPGAGGTYQKTAHALCDGLSNDHQKANAIYNWITHNISYDVKALQSGHLKEEDPEKVFKQRKGMCGGYSLLFAAMCNEVGVKAIMVDGYSKDWMFDDGDKFYIPRHAWNLVYIDQKWRLVDATWGAGGLTQAPGWLKRKLNKTAKNPLMTSGKLKFRFQYDTTYLFSDPLAFRIKHLPSDPLWQLTDTCMPLVVFEAGEIAIKKFNAQYPALAENRTEHDKLSSMDDNGRMQASAERITGYNPRYHVAMAAKAQADAIDSIKANEIGASDEAANVLSKVQQKLKDATEAVSEQKKGITTEYTALTAKNKTKNMLAKQYIRSLHSDNKRMIAQCESRLKRVNTLTATIKKKAAMAANSNKKEKTAKPLAAQPKQTLTNADEAMLKSLEDSVNTRTTRIDSLRQNILQQQNKLTAAKETSNNRLDTLASIFGLADSALTEETISRIQMHDNYDEEVLQWNRLVKTVRLQQVDSLQKNYFATYDSINNYYESLRKAQWGQIELYRKNLKDMERYKRKNDNAGFLSKYNTQSKEQQASTSAYYENLAANMAYINNHKELFKTLIKLYNRQEELSNYMEKSEEKRKELEGKNLVKKEDFDKRENAKQKEQLEEISERADEALSVK